MAGCRIAEGDSAKAALLAARPVPSTKKPPYGGFSLQLSDPTSTKDRFLGAGEELGYPDARLTFSLLFFEDEQVLVIPP
jgi:hypothetical protein